MRRLFTAVLAVALCWPVIPGPAAAQDGEGVAVVRRAGGDRASTAAAVSRALFPCGKRTACASSVVLVGAASPADALVAGPLAARLGAAVLFVGEAGPSADTVEEVLRLDVESATVVGGAASVSDEALEELRRVGVELVRVAGRDRYETAVAVARLLPGEEVVVASGSEAHRVDAAPGGTLAAALSAPLLLGDTEGLTPAVADALADRAPARVTLVGGLSSLGHAVARQAAERSGEVERIEGRNRVETSFAVAARARDHGAGLERVWVAGGSATADQLVASSAAAATGTVMVVLVPESRGGLSPKLGDWFAARRRLVGTVELVGGAGVLADATAEAVVESLAAQPTPQIGLSVETDRDRYARGKWVLIRASACNVSDRDLERDISGALRTLRVIDARGDTLAETREVFTTGFDTFRLDAGECVDLSAEWDPTQATIGENSQPIPIRGESPAPPGAYRGRLDWTNYNLPSHAPIYSEPFLITIDG